MRTAALGALVLLATALGPRAAADERLSTLIDGNPIEGSRLFASKGCLGCHSIEGAGGTRGPALGRRILNQSLLEMAAAMWNHSPRMERAFADRRLARPQFEAGEMASLLVFLYYVGSLEPPGNADVGARLFRDKGCQTCHSLGGTGGKVGPELDRYGRYASPLLLTADLWNRGPAMAEKMREKNVPRPTFEGSDIPDLLAYIRRGGGGTERLYATPGIPKRGEELFREKRCVECHALRGQGGRVGPDLGVKLKGSLMRIAGTMWNHGPKMWATMAARGVAMPAFKPEEMADLVSFLYFFQFIDRPGDPRRGETAWREKRCGGCHVASGEGVAPPPAAIADKHRAPLELITAMWNHSGQMQRRMAEANIPWPVFKRGEMADVIAFLLSPRAQSAKDKDAPR